MEAIPPFPDDVSTADISFVDFKRLINGDEEECRKVFAAAQGTGFFYLSNTDIDSDFLFNLAVQAFQLPREEKMKYEYGSTGGYFGYKMSGSQVVDENGTADCSEFFNMSKDEILGIVGRQDPGYPELIIQHWRKLEEFVRSSQAVATEVLRILEENLGLEAGMLRDLHGADVSGGDLARITHAPPISSETISLGEHSDFGSVTILFNAAGGLQVLSPGSREWKYVKPVPGHAIVNLGDALVKLLGGRVYSGVHRVVGSPGDQAKCHRYSVGYFARPNGNVKLRSLIDQDDDYEVFTADEWNAHRVKLRNTAQYKGKDTYEASRGTEHHLKGKVAGLVPAV